MQRMWMCSTFRWGLFLEMNDLIRQDGEGSPAPCVWFKSGFLAEAVEKELGRVDLLPDLWQEGGALAAVGQDHAVNPWA